MSDNGKYTEAPKEVMDLIVHQLNTVFHEAPQCWKWAEQFGFDKRSMTKKGVCPTLEEQLEKVKKNLAAEESISNELAGHIVDALIKVAKEQNTLEGTAALDQFKEIMSDNGKYTEAPKEVMDLIVHQLNTVFHEAPQCWKWAEQFGFDKRNPEKPPVMENWDEVQKIASQFSKKGDPPVMKDWDEVQKLASQFSKKGDPPVMKDWDEVQKIASQFSKKGDPPVMKDWDEVQKIASQFSKRTPPGEDLDWDKIIGVAQAVSKRTSKTQ